MSPTGGPDAKVLVVAGETGSGKSTACRWLADRGAFVIEADRVGHELLLDPEVVAGLVEEFGDEILDGRGGVDRRRLGRTVFADGAALERLNRRIHPPLVAEIQRRIDALRGSRAAELIVVDAALHFQFEPRLACDAAIMTVVEPGLQIQRIRARDGLSEEEAAARIARQAPVRASRELADAVLGTDSPGGQVRLELIAIVDRILGTSLAESDPELAGLPESDSQPKDR